jgi:ribosomal protein S27E
MHNCTWWWGCGNEAFIHSDCHAQLKGRTCTNMIQRSSRGRKKIKVKVKMWLKIFCWRS